KTVNSPFFGGRRTIESVEQAVMLLGMQNVVNIATSLSLQQSMEAADYPALDRFFDTARDVALVSAALADQLEVMPPDQAFTLGLFHDCGIPLLMHRFPHYKDVLEAANHAPDRPFTVVEEQHLATNHAVVGYYVSRNWGLPESMGHTILNHHRINEFLMAEQIEEPVEGRSSMASRISMLAMAEHFSYAYRGREAENDWPQVADMVMAHFLLGEEDLNTLQDEMLEKLDREAAQA
ncbi:MAG TPA: HDOD domain-containing protein, partial [Gammaproteobacteria bacterium]|nr:HDOD domain-containing protein [Gammaproteobacteria bacterium]